MSLSINIPIESIANKIFVIRGKKVMFDEDLAHIYGVKTKDFNRAIKRNLSRFPEDFMFALTKKEYENLRFRFGTSSWGGRRYLPYVFTEHGIAMLSSILNTEKAIQMNIQIIRTFTKLREIVLENKELSEKLKELESKYDAEITKIFEIIKSLILEEEKPKGNIGFKK